MKEENRKFEKKKSTNYLIKEWKKNEQKVNKTNIISFS